MNNALKLEDVSSYFISTILNIIFLIAFFSILYLVIKTFEKSNFYNNLVNKRKYSELLYNIVVGLLVSSIGAWYLKFNDWNITLYIISLMSFSYFFKKPFLFATIPLTLLFIVLYFFYNYNSQIQTSFYYLILNLILYILWMAWSIATLFIKLKNNLIFVFILFNSLLTSALIIIPVLVTQVINKLVSIDIFSFIFNFLFYLIISISSYGIFKLIERFIKKTDDISKNISYKDGFIIQKYAMSSIEKYIKNNNINHALIVKFMIEGLETLIQNFGSSYVTSIRKKVLEKIKSKLNNYSPLFYLQKNNTEYFCIIKIEDIRIIDLQVFKKGNQFINRNKDDYLSFLQQSIKDCIDELKREDIFIDITCLVSIYGITTNNIEDINHNLSKIKNIDTSKNLNNILYIDSYKNYNYVKKSPSDILSDYGLFKPNDISIKLIKEKIKNKNYYTIDAICIKPFFTNKQEIINHSPDQNIKNAITSHISAKALIEYKHNFNLYNQAKLLIDYPKSYIDDSDFNINTFLSKLKSYGLSLDHYCLSIIFDNQDISQNFINKIKQLALQGLSISFTNVQKISKSQNILKSKSLGIEFIRFI